MEQLIARLWIFADSHDVPALQNIAVDTFVRKISLTAEPVTRADAHFILDNTVDSSLLRKLVHRLLCHNVSDTWRWLADDDFAKVVASLPGRGERWRGSFWGPHKASLAYPCEFHVHDDGHRCKN